MPYYMGQFASIINIITQMDPQPCKKCNNLPEDILMLACSHDLCLNCAADRLNFEMKKKKPATSIVCEFCYERTPLDLESIIELEKLIPVKFNAQIKYSSISVNTSFQQNPQQVKLQVEKLQSNNLSKKKIQQAFQNLRNSINAQEKEIMTKCDKVLTENSDDLEKISASIVKRIQQMASSMADAILGAHDPVNMDPNDFTL